MMNPKGNSGIIWTVAPKLDEMEEVAQRRVWIGNGAISVDAIGGLSWAFAIAKQKAYIPQDRYLQLQPKEEASTRRTGWLPVRIELQGHGPHTGTNEKMQLSDGTQVRGVFEEYRFQRGSARLSPEQPSPNHQIENSPRRIYPGRVLAVSLPLYCLGVQIQYI